jgi:hypothetical protein
MAKLFDKSITFRLSGSLFDLLTERAKQEHRSLSSLIVHLLTQALLEQKQ